MTTTLEDFLKERPDIDMAEVAKLTEELRQSEARSLLRALRDW